MSVEEKVKEMSAEEKVKEMSAKRRAEKEALRAASCGRLHPIIRRMIDNPMEYRGDIVNYGLKPNHQQSDEFRISDCPEVESLMQSVNLNNPNIKFSYNPEKRVEYCVSVLHEEKDAIVHNFYERPEPENECTIQ